MKVGRNNRKASKAHPKTKVEKKIKESNDGVLCKSNIPCI
jgi:hypothetical protein